ncbi:MAG: hypothetical protein ACXQTG_06525 [Methanoculleaceae archaeon]
MRIIRVLPLLREIVYSTLVAIDGTRYRDLTGCPRCGGRVDPHDYRKKRFATLIDGGRDRRIDVYVRRFHCRLCGRLIYAPSPFYPGTRLGAPVVDCCIALGRCMPAARAAKVMEVMGIRVDRGTIINYLRSGIGPIPVIRFSGLPLPVSLFSLAAGTLGNESMPIKGAVHLWSGGLPSTYGAPFQLPGRTQKGNQRDKEKQEEEWESRSLHQQRQSE